MSREGESDFFDKLIVEEEQTLDAQSISKTASIKETNNSHPIKKSAKMTLREARMARRSGSFIKVAGRVDLYQDTKTNDFWKISDDKQHIERQFDENNSVIA